MGGLLNGAAFESIADADSRLGPVLEVLVGGAYYWAPFACIKYLVIEGPRDARDFAWLPAQFVWRNGDRSMGFIPARYPGSERSDNDAIRLARTTRWQHIGENSPAGLGQRLLKTNTGTIGILDVIDLSVAPDASASHAQVGPARDGAGSQVTHGERPGEEFELTGSFPQCDLTGK